MKTRALLGAICCVGVVGCSGGAEDGRSPFGSQAMVASRDFSALYVANAEEGSVTRLTANLNGVTAINLDGEPTRIARTEQHVLVTLRAKRQVAVLREEGHRLVSESFIDVGAEPVGIVALEDGSRFYVASSMSGFVEEFDGVSLERLRVWQIDGEPRWLAVRPQADVLFVAPARKSVIYQIDLTTGTLDNRPLAFQGLTGRITGDPAISPSGEELAVPVIFVDNNKPIPVSAEDAQAAASPVGYVSAFNPAEVGRLNPTVVLVPIDEYGFDPELRSVVQVRNRFRAGYASSVTYSPDGRFVIAPLEAADALALFPSEPGDSGLLGRRDGIQTNTGPFAARPVEIIPTAHGPRSVAFTESEEAAVYSFIDRTAARLDFEEIRDAKVDRLEEEGRVNLLSLGRGVSVAAGTLSPEEEWGRRLFYSAVDRRVARPGAAVSCATCHFDSRDDGLTWHFIGHGPRQTPSLAGIISSRAPVRWAGDGPSVAADAFGTSQQLMGGTGLLDADAEAIAAYIDHTRAVDLPLAGSSDPQVQLGREVFTRGDVGCVGCHDGPLYSDLASHDVEGFVGVKTPSLLGVGASAPYFHDGMAPSLEDVVSWGRPGHPAVPQSLSGAELEALVAFLQSL